MVACQQQRFIPAHAGNRAYSVEQSSGMPVHPRACGEQSPVSPAEYPVAGSSPRMRGTVKTREGASTVDRFIPAHAGNRMRTDVEVASSAVHPRACGEQGSPVTTFVTCHGSSPRMRGTVDHGDWTAQIERFIPAHAGNSTPIR